MLHWYVVFAYMIAQIAIISFLMLPINAHSKRPVVRFLAMLGRHTYSRTTIWVVSGILTAIFLDCLRSIYNLKNVLALSQMATTSTENMMQIARLYSVERNAYLCGITVFFTIMLFRFESVINDMIKLEEKASVAQQENPEVAKILEEKHKYQERTDQLKKELHDTKEELRIAQKSNKFEQEAR